MNILIKPFSITRQTNQSGRQLFMYENREFTNNHDLFGRCHHMMHNPRPPPTASTFAGSIDETNASCIATCTAAA
jgi:hypothetical protein